MRNSLVNSVFPSTAQSGKKPGLPFLLILTLAGVMVLGGGAWAKAEEEETQTKVAAQRGHQLENITVTAQKQEEKLQEVPISVSVLSGTTIEDANIQNVMDMADFIPNLFIFATGTSGTNTPTTREIYAPTESTTVSTGLFVDGVPILTPTGYNPEMLDVERIEVLRGPQGTLYGT